MTIKDDLELLRTLKIERDDQQVGEVPTKTQALLKERIAKLEKMTQQNEDEEYDPRALVREYGPRRW